MADSIIIPDGFIPQFKSSASSAGKRAKIKKKFKHCCAICGNSFYSRSNIIRHAMKVHQTTKNEAYSLLVSKKIEDRSSKEDQNYEDNNEIIVFAVDCSTHEEIPLDSTA